MPQECPECRTVNADGLGDCLGCGAKLRGKPYIPIPHRWEFALVIGLIVLAVLYILAGR